MRDDGAMREAFQAIPLHMQDGLALWINYGIPPGSFLMAVLENNLMEAFRSADQINRHHLFQYANFLYNFAPSSCHGSPEKVRDWAKMGGLEGCGPDHNNAFEIPSEWVAS